VIGSLVYVESGRVSFRQMRTSGIGNQEIWILEIGQILHLRAEIIKLRLDRAEFNDMTTSQDPIAQVAIRMRNGFGAGSDNGNWESEIRKSGF